ncbi:DUF6233 domain-containing protein [Streptomyces venezuelae]|uniref:DUF6233 domain-containing protein n=1 Tax=Streptomyces venezuelae TaxID=54571 RepID=UPI0034552F4F
MLDDLPPDLDRLETLRTWHAMWLDRIDSKIAWVREEQEQQARAARQRERRAPDWIVELGIGRGSPPIEVHRGDCHAAGKKRKPITRDEARRALAEGIRACTHCQPDAELRMLE